MHRLSDGEREVLRECERDAESGVMADYKAALADLRRLLDDPTFSTLYDSYLSEDNASHLTSMAHVLRDRAEEMGLDGRWDWIEGELEDRHSLCWSH